jgi:hypothetical protein
MEHGNSSPLKTSVSEGHKRTVSPDSQQTVFQMTRLPNRQNPEIAAADHSVPFALFAANHAPGIDG